MLRRPPRYTRTDTLFPKRRSSDLEPRVLLLDDATSAVDPRVEGAILDGLRRSVAATTLIVAHRVSTIALADRVLLLDGGRIAADGTHRELLRVPAYRSEEHTSELQSLMRISYAV